MSRTFGKNESTFRIGAEGVRARLEPEQSGQRQPFLFQILNQVGFPLVE